MFKNYKVTTGMGKGSDMKALEISLEKLAGLQSRKKKKATILPKGWLLSVMILAFLSLLLLPGKVLSTDSPWPMFQHDAQHTGYSTDTTISPLLKQVWVYVIPEGIINSSPTINNGIVYVGSWSNEGSVYAIDAVQGMLKWKYSIKSPTIFSSVATFGDKVYIASTGSQTFEDSYLYALSADTGSLIWRFRLGPPGAGSPSSPVVFGGVVYVGSSGGSAEDNKINAINAETGNLIWQTHIIDPYETRKWVQSSPAVTDDTVIVGTWGSCYWCPTLFAFDRTTGTQKWSAIVDTPYIFPAPSYSNGIIYVRSGGAGWSGDLIAFDEETGAEIWRKNVGNCFMEGSPAIADGIVYAGSGWNVFAFDAYTGNQVWSVPAVSAGSCDYAATIAYPFLAVANGMIFIKSNNACFVSKVYALSVNDGSLLWDSGILGDHATAQGNDSSTPSIANGWLYFAIGNTLYAFGPAAPPPLQPVLSVTPDTLDFGSVTVGSSKDLDFTVQNTGNGTLSGTASTSAPFSIVTGDSFNLAAGESQAVSIRFSPNSSGNFTETVDFTSNGGNASLLVQGEGVLPPALSVTPSLLDFGTLPVGQNKDLTFTVQNTGGGTLIGNATTTEPFSIIGGSPFSLAAGQTQTVVVRFNPISEGTFTAKVNFVSNGGNTYASVSGIGFASSKLVKGRVTYNGEPLQNIIVVRVGKADNADKAFTFKFKEMSKTDAKGEYFFTNYIKEDYITPISSGTNAQIDNNNDGLHGYRFSPSFCRVKMPVNACSESNNKVVSQDFTASLKPTPLDPLIVFKLPLPSGIWPLTVEAGGYTIINGMIDADPSHTDTSKSGFYALDFSKPKRSTAPAILASREGKIFDKGTSSAFGNFVIIDHEDGYYTRHAHLDRFAPGLKIGKDIRQGDFLGCMGKTGISEGVHLHFQIYYGGQSGQYSQSGNEQLRGVRIETGSELLAVIDFVAGKQYQSTNAAISSTVCSK